MIRLMIRLSDYLTENLIVYSIKGKSSEEVLEELSQLLYSRGIVKNRDKLLQELRKREELGSTAIDNGVAIPHCKLDEIEKVVAAVGISRQGVSFNSVDHKPTHIFFLLVSPQKAIEEHLLALAAISHIARRKEAKKSLINAKDSSGILEAIKEWEQKK